MGELLSPAMFAILNALVEERSGLHYRREDSGLFDARIASRVAEAGFHSVLDYYYFLRYDAAAATELDALVDDLAIGETYFFRELVPLRAAVEHVIQPAVAKNGRARIWSAACATGEEPLSLAMMLEESGIRERCTIVATDISVRAVERCRAGVYGARSLRLLSPSPPPQGFTPELAAIANAWLRKDGSGARVSSVQVDAIEYRRLNLLDERAVAQLGSFDLVLCRNVLIYFADPTVKRVVATLAASMKADARLLCGTSESLLRFGTALGCEERGGAFFYGRNVG